MQATITLCDCDYCPPGKSQAGLYFSEPETEISDGFLTRTGKFPRLGFQSRGLSIPCEHTICLHCALSPSAAACQFDFEQERWAVHPEFDTLLSSQSAMHYMELVLTDDLDSDLRPTGLYEFQNLTGTAKIYQPFGPHLEVEWEAFVLFARDRMLFREGLAEKIAEFERRREKRREERAAQARDVVPKQTPKRPLSKKRSKTKLN